MQLMKKAIMMATTSCTFYQNALMYHWLYNIAKERKRDESIGKMTYLEELREKRKSSLIVVCTLGVASLFYGKCTLDMDDKPI